MDPFSTNHFSFCGQVLIGSQGQVIVPLGTSIGLYNKPCFPMFRLATIIYTDVDRIKYFLGIEIFWKIENFVRILNFFRIVNFFRIENFFRIKSFFRIENVFLKIENFLGIESFFV